jgi:hypothetical protein
MFKCTKCELQTEGHRTHLETNGYHDTGDYTIAELCGSCWREVMTCLTHKPVEISRAIEAIKEEGRGEVAEDVLVGDRRNYLTAHSEASLSAYYLDYGRKYIR